jgi:hypothetical protein
MFIDNIYNNAIAHDIRGGTFTIVWLFDLSPVSEERLQELAQDYGWEVDYGE